MRYRNIMASPTIVYSIPVDIASTINASLGIGLNFRRISRTLTVTTETGVNAGEKNFHQDDFGPSLQLGLSADANISESLYLAPGIAFDFIYDRHPDQGDFGNTGGFCFTFGAGLSF